jgi:hypothetical protein
VAWVAILLAYLDAHCKPFENVHIVSHQQIQNVNYNNVEKMTFGSGAMKPKHKYTQNLQDDW